MNHVVTSLLLEATGDLNQLAQTRLPWLASADRHFDATPSHVDQEQKAKAAEIARTIHGASQSEWFGLARQMDLGTFATRYPSEWTSGDAAQDDAREQFNKLLTKHPNLSAHIECFEDALREFEALKLPKFGRKPRTAYPYAVVFHVWPSAESWSLFTKAARTLIDEKDISIDQDPFEKARGGAGPLFEYFTNRISGVSGESNATRAMWFEFDIAASVEALKAPHRYRVDTLARQQRIEELDGRIAAVESKGESSTQEDTESSIRYGFQGR